MEASSLPCGSFEILIGPGLTHYLKYLQVRAAV